MDRAVEILSEKIREKKPIRVIGDYDIDGVNATYILLEGIEKLGGVVDSDIPDRMKDGYGLNQELINRALEAGVDTIITCDNGIAAVEEIAYAKKMGMTIIVTDHHEIPYEEKMGKKCMNFHRQMRSLIRSGSTVNIRSLPCVARQWLISWWKHSSM